MATFLPTYFVFIIMHLSLAVDCFLTIRCNTTNPRDKDIFITDTSKLLEKFYEIKKCSRTHIFNDFFATNLRNSYYRDHKGYPAFENCIQEL